MKDSTMKNQLKPIAAAVSLALVTGNAVAIDYYLAAKAYTMTLPDGTEVPMWGYVEDSGGACFGAASDGDRLTCIDGLPDPSAPGPRLEVPSDQTALRIYLSNGLTEPTSIVVTGQKLPIGNYPGISATSGPTWSDGSTGGRTSAAQRVRSFVPEAPAEGGRMGYIWNNNQQTPIDRPGTFIYHSGTWPQKQVYMGLAGLVTKDAANGEVYDAVPYGQEVTLFYSDIDPDFNDAVADGTLETAVDRHPSWFLVNGAPYEQGVTPDIEVGPADTSTLVRFASTASDTHVAVVQGMTMAILAEDGLVYNFQTATGDYAAPRTQYSAMLPPLKTKDAILNVPSEGGRFAVYDGNGYMTNPSDPVDESAGDTVGGMLRFLAFEPGDADGDGVPDTLDQCPNTPLGEDVDADGCAESQLDADGDGVSDADDQCPGTPSGEAVDALGCSASQLDADSDGVSDALDQCPNTPSGETVDGDGCSASQLDADSDGVSDALDLCPNTPSGETVDADGCSASQLDDDGDGVTNDLDLCPGTPADTPVDADGCELGPVDADGDGFTEDQDCNDSDAGIYPGADEIKHDDIDQDCNGYDLTIDITRARYLTGSDRLVIWATSDLGDQAALEMVVDLDGGGTFSQSFNWNASQGRWQRGINNFSQGTPVSVTVSGPEGMETAPIEQR